MEEQEGNKIIAEFMGGRKVEIYSGGYKQSDKVWDSDDFKNPLRGCRYYDDTLEYHSSWDWLMPVVQKIEKICYDNGFELSNNSKKQEHLSNQLDNPLHWKSWSYHSIRLSTDINAIYKQVVEFIKWYNNGRK